jgi:hypothetical protein
VASVAVARMAVATPGSGKLQRMQKSEPKKIPNCQHLSPKNSPKIPQIGPKTSKNALKTPKFAPKHPQIGYFFPLSKPHALGVRDAKVLGINVHQLEVKVRHALLRGKIGFLYEKNEWKTDENRIYTRKTSEKRWKLWKFGWKIDWNLSF